MAAQKEKKTNAMRLLDGAGVAYRIRSYPCGKEHLDGKTVAGLVGLPPARVFKTLVAAEGEEPVVCCIPVDKQLDLKALAAAAGAKRLELVPLGDLPKLTGYVRGGVSPVGMKKRYATFVDRSALDWEEIAVSAGIKGLQLLVDPAELIRFAEAVSGPFAREGGLDGSF